MANDIGSGSDPLPVPVIIGSPRSGTTLLRLMLDAHPDLAIPPETGFMALGERLIQGAGTPAENFIESLTNFPPHAPAWADFGIPAEQLRAELEKIAPFNVSDGLRAFYRLYAARLGKPRWGDKTPGYCHHIATIAQILPEARFIHLVRDGRDVAVSLRPRWFSPGYGIEIQARYWRDNVQAAMRSGEQCRHYLEMRYENLVRNPEPELRRVCEFIELDYHDGMLNYFLRAPQRLAEHRERRRSDGSLVVSHEERLRQQARTCAPPDPARISMWTAALSEDEIDRFDEVAGDMLADLGYARK